MLSLILLVSVTPAITSFDYFGHNCSSYFALSFLKIPPTVEEGIGTFKADTEVACASRCCHHRACTDAVFCKAARRCSLYNARETILTEFQTESQEASTGYIRIKKVIIARETLQSRGKYAIHGTGTKTNADFSPLSDSKTDSWSSCGEILKQNSSKPSGTYNLTDKNLKWTTNCQMEGIDGCGGGAWTLVMRVNGSQGTFRYHSTAWRNTATVTKRRETMLPGYWLSPFKKICIHFRFNATKTTLVLSHTASSLHSVLQQGSNQAMTQVLFSQLVFPWIPTTLDNSCLEKGLNVITSYNTRIVKARIGLFLNKTRCPYPSPYFARGVGIGLSMGFPDNITCGDIYLDDDGDDDDDEEPVATPASCKIYIQ